MREDRAQSTQCFEDQIVRLLKHLPVAVGQRLVGQNPHRHRHQVIMEIFTFFLARSWLDFIIVTKGHSHCEYVLVATPGAPPTSLIQSETSSLPLSNQIWN